MEKTSREARRELSLDVAVKIARPGTISVEKVVKDAEVIEKYLEATD